jgi:ankyrin repeat protein
MEDLKLALLLQALTKAQAHQREVAEEIKGAPNELFRAVLESFGKSETSSHVQRVKPLIQEQTQKGSLDVKDSKGRTALYVAVQSRQHKTARLLVEAGADPFGDDEHSPLRLLFFGTKNSGTLVFAKWLLEYLDAQGKRDQIAHRLNTPFSLLPDLCHKKAPQVVTLKLLLDYGANVNATVRQGFTALHTSALRGHTSLIQLLLAHGAEVNVLTETGFSPLHLAAIKGHGHAAIALLEAGAFGEALCGENEDQPVKSRKNAADLADIEKHPLVAQTIRDWKFWNDSSVTIHKGTPSEENTE